MDKNLDASQVATSITDAAAYGDLYQWGRGTNNPCPSGFRIPAEAEFNAEKATWSSQYSAGAYASALKFTAAGLRVGNNGSFSDVGSYGDYWSSSVGGIYSRTLVFSSCWVANINSYNRANGHSVRCIKD